MDVRNMSRMDKFNYSEAQLNEGIELFNIAEKLEMKLDSLYVLRSNVRKDMKKVGGLKRAIQLISFENLTEYLEVRSEIDRNEYLLGQITGDRKPLRSNTLLIIKAMRNMLEEYNYHG